MLETPPLRKRKVREEKRPACDECRNHKLRCDAFRNYSNPCSRCLRKGVECVVPQERRKKTVADENHDPSPTHGSTTSSNGRGSLIDHAPFGAEAPHSLSAQTSLPVSNIAPTGPPFNVEVRSFVPPEPVLSHDPQTTARSIGSVRVEAHLIDSCFARRFNRYFAPIVPILPSTPHPNETFRECPLKFWVIVAIGSKKCFEDPTLFESLSTHVETMALTSLFPGQSSSHPILEALLLMSMWHLSTDKPFFANIYFTISSAVVTLAVQAGMHRCSSLRSVFPERKVSAQDEARGTELWAYAVVANQSAMTINGIPTNDVLESAHLLQRHDCCSGLPDSLILWSRSTAIITRLQRVLYDLESESEPKTRDRILKSFMVTFEAELRDLDSSVEPKGPMDKLHLAIARLHIRSLALFISESMTDYIEMAQLTNAAISTMDAVARLQEIYQISFHCPNYILQAVLIAACCLLKLIKGYPPEVSGGGDSTRALFSAINIFKDASVVNNDTPAKISQILSQLWSSEKVYRDADGSYLRSLHIRNRSTGSVIFDTWYWWRKLTKPWTHCEPDKTEPSTAASEMNQGSELPNGFVQSFFDDSWNWDIDWRFISASSVMP